MKEPRTCQECDKEYIKRKAKANSKYTVYCSNKWRSESTNRRGAVFNKAYRDKVKLMLQSPQDHREFIVRTTYIRYRGSAKKRGYDFNISQETMDSFFMSNCHYCNMIIPSIGLDRVENSIGYVISNIVPCCAVCNRMKRTESRDEFINKCRAIVKNHDTP